MQFLREEVTKCDLKMKIQNSHQEEKMCKMVSKEKGKRSDMKEWNVNCDVNEEHIIKIIESSWSQTSRKVIKL